MVSFEHWVPAYVALGSNLDDPVQQIARAFDALARLPHSQLVARSAAYRSRPFGPVEQPDFVNAVAGLLTRLDPEQMLKHLQAAEERLGRATPVVRWGPRRIDLDLLVHGDSRRDGPDLQLPHPGIPERAVVLAPLAEIAPDLMVPGLGRASALLRRVDAGALQRIAS
jgi:2-amino-4-hydroxy-6-hydroxymethyldihydropteridine diphosphokinase